ncbi:hypothetical protein AC1031_007629 [Aphanomyces cochlioides]|nr:hypothetical protein AC1031_007629 [Aphanomyces cochlioides]
MMACAAAPAPVHFQQHNESPLFKMDSPIMTIRDLLNPLDDTVPHVPSFRVQSRKRPLEIRLPMARLQFARTSSRSSLAVSQPSTPLSSDDSTASPKVEASTTLAPTQCRYRNGKCTNTRATKTNGQLHTLCAMHRQRNIANQHRVDARRRSEREAKKQESVRYI